MNDEVLKDYAKTVRSIAEKADPFTKKRLLELAARYEGSVGRPSRSTRQLTAPPDAETGQVRSHPLGMG
jgi:hypothetical protein